jgi:hypothetical protein
MSIGYCLLYAAGAVSWAVLAVIVYALFRSRWWLLFLDGDQ